MSNCSLVFFNRDVLRCGDVGLRHQHLRPPGAPPARPQVSRGVRTLRWPQPRTLLWPRTPVPRRSKHSALDTAAATARYGARAQPRRIGRSSMRNPPPGAAGLWPGPTTIGRMRFGILGALAVWRDGEPVKVGGLRVRMLL